MTDADTQRARPAVKVTRTPLALLAEQTDAIEGKVDMAIATAEVNKALLEVLDVRTRTLLNETEALLQQGWGMERQVSRLQRTVERLSWLVVGAILLGIVATVVFMVVNVTG